MTAATPFRWFPAVPALALPTLALTILMAACSPSPWVDSRREAGTTETVGQSTPERPAICYDPGTTTASQLQAMAQKECSKSGKNARYIGVDRWQCSLTTPYRAYYRCQ